METPETPAAPEVEVEVNPPAAEPSRPEPPDQNLVGEAKRKQKQAEKEAADLRNRLEALEDRDKSETERERKAREKAEQRATEAESKVQKLERGGWVRQAAKDFHDPSDAVANIDLADVESEADATRAVKDLAKRKSHLVKSAEAPAPQIGRVVDEGRQVDRSQPAPDTPSQAEQDAAVVAAELEKIGVFPPR